ncbi:hypothetical protein [Streptomyces griseus]|uniref:hypothetical protein n=1 Tax=Streptomyces griseus TaxID=1911 RepID=UPI00099B82C5|nr:hypothetical protein [Streptomyces griseus]
MPLTPSPSYAPSPYPSLFSSPAASPAVRPPGAEAPATCEVPHFAPVRVRGGRQRIRRLLGNRRRAVAAGLALTAAALVAAGPTERGEADRARGHPESQPPTHTASLAGDRAPERRAVEMVTAPVRIADAATVRLLRSGDRVDVIAAGQTATGGDAQVVAHGALVTKVPEAADSAAGDGALVVLSVPRATAARLVGAGATARLAVTLC